MKLSHLLWLFIYLRATGRSDARGCCTNGFPSRLVYQVPFRTGPSTRLIPEMSFTCNGVIVGYTATLREQNGNQDPIIQIWRKNTSQPESYYKTEAGIVIDKALCIGGLSEVSSGVFHCNLKTTTRVCVQPGDILGLELPPGNNDDIILGFARVSSGPTNYVFNRRGLSSPAALSNSNSVNWELPQITLEIGSDCCLSGFPNVVDHEESSGRGEWASVTTRLFPDLKFGCFGTIVGVTAAVVDYGRSQDPKIQVWRENKTQPGLYHKISSDIPLNSWRPPCYQHDINNKGIFQCILNEDHRISVQPGDFLGIEIPPIADDDLEIYFKAGGPTNLVFQRQLDSMVNISTEPHFVTKDEPQITFLVVLAENTADKCSCDTTPGLSITTQTESNLTITTNSETPKSYPLDASNVIGGMGALIAILLLVATILLVVHCQNGKQKLIMINSNPARDGNLPKESHVAVMIKMDSKDNIYSADDDKKDITDCNCDIDCKDTFPNPAYCVSSEGSVPKELTVDDCDKGVSPAYNRSY